jgi:hypothetical protein
VSEDDGSVLSEVTGDDDEAGTTAEYVRPGPSVLEADTWDIEPGQDPADGPYQGRHHVRTPPPRVWLAVAVVLVGVGSAVAIPLYLTRSPEPRPGAIPALTGVRITAESPGESTSAALTPTPSRTPTPVPSTRLPAQPQPAPTTPPPTAPPAFAPLTIEAETGVLGGSANVRAEAGASGGKVVRNLGNWSTPSGPGTVQLTNVVIPTTGTYVLTFFYYHPDGELTRSAQITVSGVAPVTVTFSGTSTCCQTKAVSLTIPAGTHTITVANPTTHAPSLDKVVLSRS